MDLNILDGAVGATAAVGGGGSFLVLVGLFLRRVLSSTKNAESTGSSFDAMQKSNEAVYKQITQEVNRLGGINAALSTEVVELKGQVGKLTGLVETLSSANVALKANLNELTDEVTYYRSEVSKAFSEKPDLGIMPYGRRATDRASDKSKNVVSENDKPIHAPEPIVSTPDRRGSGVFAQPVIKPTQYKPVSEGIWNPIPKDTK